MKPRFGELRRNKGLMQNFCAEKAGLSQQQWSDFERGIKYPRIDKAQKIAIVLGCTLNDLYELEDKVEDQTK